MFDALSAQELADVWEALYDAREDATTGGRMFKVRRLHKMMLALYDAPNWDNRALRLWTPLSTAWNTLIRT